MNLLCSPCGSCYTKHVTVRHRLVYGILLVNEHRDIPRERSSFNYLIFTTTPGNDPAADAMTQPTQLVGCDDAHCDASKDYSGL